MEVLNDITYKVLSNRVKIIDSYKITDRSKMSEIIYAIQYKHPEIKFNREYNDLIREWVAHNRLYKWKINQKKTKNVNLEFNECKIKTLLYNILSI